MEEPEHNPEHGRRRRGPKKQSPNGQGKRPRKSYSWRATIHVETNDTSVEALTLFHQFVNREISPGNAIIHSISSIEYPNDGERKRPRVRIDVTVHSSVAGGQRNDLYKQLRVMCGLKRTTKESDDGAWLQIVEPQRSIRWVKVISD